MNKEKIRMLREAIEENLDVSTLIEVLNLDSGELLDLIDDEWLVDAYDDFADIIPNFANSFDTKGDE